MYIEVNYGHVDGTDFYKVVKELEYEFGYKGQAWDMVVASGDMEVLAGFLAGEGLVVELDGEVVC
ncbi:gp243 [Bacillus phage W.Ph.]|uniref:Gp243 n=1 Tax=Bacillus phage W.Ph. TaxID=764595 RepID=G9B1Z4_9CAUD|nr:gp243 [Bacillus phage W.Ph.]ADH03389.1 gp243 [Bacillus phage W.Ph.]